MAKSDRNLLPELPLRYKTIRIQVDLQVWGKFLLLTDSRDLILKELLPLGNLLRGTLFSWQFSEYPET